MRLKRSDRRDHPLFVQKDLSLVCKDDSGIRIFLRCICGNPDPALIRIKSYHRLDAGVLYSSDRLIRHEILGKPFFLHRF